MFSKVQSAALNGLDAYLVRVEADVSDGMPQFLMVGYLSSEVREAGDRVRTALRNTGVYLPPKRITVNLAPAGVRKAGTRFDLPVAVALLAALGLIPAQGLEKVMLAGELSLSGQVLGIPGVLALVEEARRQGMKYCVVPKENESEGKVLSGIQVVGVSSLEECIRVLQKLEEIQAEEIDVQKLMDEKEDWQGLDFAQINGQAAGRRAAEVAAAGMHNLLMIGPPGSGKSMLAKRIPGILPPLSLEESLEISKIYSVAGLLPKDKPILVRRPFRSPHHTVSPWALAGGGRIPSPGEISLSSRGILFLDELPEFQRSALEILRQPMEERKICISRASGNYTFPADFMLVAAMNPCPCGYYPDRRLCRCREEAVSHYLGKISRPLLDRIDICTEVPKLSYEDLTGKVQNEASREIRARVEAAHAIQRNRFQGRSIHFNAQMDGKDIKEFCALGDAEERLLQEVYKKLNLSGRSYHKILKVARTIADLEGAKEVLESHILEAVRYRTPEQNFWAREA